MIRKESDGYHIYSHDGKKHLGGPYSKTKAEDRLRQIEYFKHIKENNMNKKLDTTESNVSRILNILEGNLQTVTIEKSQGEYRVPSEDGYEDGAYYTVDKKDAEGVAFKVFGKDIIIKFRSVPEFVGGKYEKYRPKGKKNESLDEGYEPDAKQLDRTNKNLETKYKTGKRQTAWKIYSNGKYKTTVFYDNDCDADYVKRAENADKVVKESLNEAFTDGSWIKQERKDATSYAKVISKQSNGAYKVVSCDDDRMVAATTSTKGWYPAPVSIPESSVPAKIKAKIEKKIASMNESLDEGTMDLALRAKIIEVGVPVPSSLTVQASRDIKKKLRDKGRDDLADEVDKEGNISWTNIEKVNQKKFSI